MAGTSGTFSATVDLSDPTNRGTAMQFLTDSVNGHAASAARELTKLANSSTIVVQANNVSTKSAGFDADVAAVKMTTTTTVNQATWVKPPDGTFTQVNP